MKTASKCFCLLGVSSLICVVIAEIFLRIIGFSYPALFEPDYQIGWKHRPRSEGAWRSEGDAYIRINDAGFRDLPRSNIKPQGTLRVAILGDSYADALQVDIDDTFWRRLELLLAQCDAFTNSKVEVLNFGISGFGTFQELLSFQEYASRYDPDIVLLAVTVGNDISDNSVKLAMNKNRPFPTLVNGRVVADMSFRESSQFKRRSSTAYRFVRRALNLRLAQGISAIRANVAKMRAAKIDAGRNPGSEYGLNDQVFQALTTASWDEAWILTEVTIKQLNAVVQEFGASLFVATLSSAIQVHPDPSARSAYMSKLGIQDLYYPDHRIEALSRTLKIRHVRLSSAMLELAEKKNLYFHGFPNTKMGTGHWNENGHRVGARLIADSMCNQYRSDIVVDVNSPTYPQQ